jgi:hypothetical protein
MLFAMGTEPNRYPTRTSVLTRFRPAAWIAMMAVALSACSWHPGRGLKSCKYDFRSFAFTGMDANQSHWRVDVAVANPNTHDVSLTRMRFALLYQADTLLSGWNPESKTLAAKDSTLVSTTLDIPNMLFTKLPREIWSQTDARFVIVADAYLHTWVGDILVPQAIKDTVHINMPEQVAKYKEVLMRQFFSWPGRRLQDGGINAPDANPPRPDRATPGDDPL